MEEHRAGFLMDHLVQSAPFRGLMYAASAGLIIAGALSTVAEFTTQEPSVAIQEHEPTSEESFDIGKIVSPLEVGLGATLALVVAVASDKSRRKREDDQ